MAVDVSSGRLPSSHLPHTGPCRSGPVPVEARPASVAQYWSVVLRGPGGCRYAPRLVEASLADPSSFRPHLVGIARMEDPGRAVEGEHWVGDFELEVFEPGTAPAGVHAAVVAGRSISAEAEFRSTPLRQQSVSAVQPSGST